jgi:hypothetical protein
MTNERYPVDLAVTPQDFAECGWQAALSGEEHAGYPAMWQSFSNAARLAIEGGRNAHGKVLWLLADACSMMLSPASINAPFKPLMEMEGRRSVIPEDLNEADVLFFSQIVELADNPWLKARLADLVWLLQRKMGAQFALDAIDAYLAIPIRVSGGLECWKRAISLTLMLGSGAGERIKETEDVIVTTFESATKEDGFRIIRMADLLSVNRLARKKSPDIASKLEGLARGFNDEGDLHCARSFFEAASNWFQKSGNTAKAAEMSVSVAEGWVKEAIGQASNMVAASFYEKAMQVYRSIPRSERVTHKADERMAELYRQMSLAGKKSLDEMGIISTPGMDISVLVENARKFVKGKTAIDALIAFVNIDHGAKVAQIRTSSEQMLREHPLQALMAASHISRDGRVIAKRPAISFSGSSSDENRTAVWAQMIRYYQGGLGLVVQGEILPALNVLLLEHRLVESDFIDLARHSPIVPDKREYLFGKALFAGYEKDFITALHILIPQIEHMVRSHLKNAGVKTTNLDKDGIENENGLSTLLDLPEVTPLFGEDLTFELKALFCDAFGPNLRNELAHGLLSDGACQSVEAVYAWWFGLRLVLNTFWNSIHKPEMSESGSS